MKKFLPQRGFTLIELLIVVAIIAILTLIAISIYAGVQKRTRDSRRQAEIDSLAKSIEVRKNPTTGIYIYGADPVDATKNYYNEDYPQAKPQDPSGSGVTIPQYCYTTPKQTGIVAAWTGSNCPSSSWSVIPSAGTSPSIITSPGVTSWTICANLEANTGTFCKSSLN